MNLHRTEAKQTLLRQVGFKFNVSTNRPKLPFWIQCRGVASQNKMRELNLENCSKYMEILYFFYFSPDLTHILAQVKDFSIF